MKYTSRSVKRRVKRRALKSVKRKLKTYSKSKRSFQTGGTIPLNWTLDEQKANVKATWNNVWKPKFPYSFEKLVPVTSTIQAAFGISFQKSNQFTNMLKRGLSGTLTIEIDIDKYRHNILKLVNAILQKLFNTEVEVFKPKPNDDDFEFIASYENFDYYHKSNITEGDNIYKDSGGMVKCNSLGKLTSNGSNPSRHCIIEIDIQFTDTETIIHSIKYTSFVNKNTTCESRHGETAYGNFTYWSTTTLKMGTKHPRSSVPREGLETLYAGDGEFHVSTVVFRTDDNTDLEQKYQPSIPTIYEFDKDSFDKKKDEQHITLDSFIQHRLAEAESQ